MSVTIQLAVSDALVVDMVANSLVCASIHRHFNKISMWLYFYCNHLFIHVSHIFLIWSVQSVLKINEGPRQESLSTHALV